MGGYYPVLLTSMLMVFVAGMILESLPVTIIMAPILAPIAASVGVDPIHFSVIFLVGASIGFITPPYGLNLYVASGDRRAVFPASAVFNNLPCCFFWLDFHDT